jgi:glyoxylase-like metal-dependent hydrolase (beta-lactamase superfamily II)
MYILKDENENLALIDAGNGRSLDATIAALQNLKLNIKKLTKVIITHEHLDHVLGLYPLLEMLTESPPVVIAHPITAKILKEGDENKICPGALGISASQFGVEIKPIQVKPINEGEELTFGSYHFQVYNTPGHSLGSASFFETTQKILFPGDVVFPQGSFGRYDFPGGSLETLKQSIARLAELPVEHLCAGHMDPVIGNAAKDIGKSLKNINYLRW